MDAPPVIGIGIVMVITEVIMALTPKTFDKKRFAVPISVLVAVMLSVSDGVIRGNSGVWDSVLSGFIIAMASGGAYSTMKNYRKSNPTE